MGEQTNSFRQKQLPLMDEILSWLKTTLWPGVKAFILHHYWKLILSIGTLVLLMETIEHLSVVTNKEPFYYGEIFLIVLLLLITGYLIRMLVSILAERTQALNTLHVKKEISQCLSAGYDITDVSEQLVQQISALVPVAGVELYLYGKNPSRLVQTAQMNVPQPLDRAALFAPGSDPCRACFQHKSGERYAVNSCDRLHCPMFAGESQDVCLQLSHGSWLLGTLHLMLPDGNTLSDEQARILENVAPDISTALGIAVRKIERDEISMTQKVNSVQLEIARDLHDTIGQNISYLRMKLEHLAESRADADLSTEILHMSTVANESYDLVRGTLAMLQPNRSAHLHDLFEGHASQIIERTGLEIVIDCQGEPMPITTRQMRQLFYVFREALNNIEKHAHASRVDVQTSWLKKEMTLTITDNGQGFDLTSLLPGSHYGLKFMRDRVEQLNGCFNIWSQPGLGTRLVVSFPYESEISSLPVSEQIHNN